MSAASLRGIAMVYRRRLPLPDSVFFTCGAFESPNRRIDVTVRKNMYEAHGAMALRTSRRQRVDGGKQGNLLKAAPPP
jgi:hypothetical protein